MYSENCSVVSDSLWPHGLYNPWNSPGQNTGVGSHSLLQGIVPTQGSNPGLLHCRKILYYLGHKESQQKHGRSSQMVVQSWGKVLVPPQRVYITLSLSSEELYPWSRRRMVASGLSARFLEHCPVTSTANDQKKVIHSVALTPNFSFLFWTQWWHPVRPLVWPLSVTSTYISDSFRLNFCYYKGGCQFQT